MALATYPMERAGAKVGVALIISMEANREGGAKDRGVLEALFEALQFQVEGPYVDYSADLLKSSIQKLAKSTRLRDVDCFVCSVNAHGGTGDGRGYVLDSTVTQSAATSPEDNDQVTSAGRIDLIDDIINPFCNSKVLKGKPKVFLINACRGNTLPSGRRGGRSGKETSLLSEERMGDYIHNKEDLYLVFSTDEGEQSLRDARTGTLFVESLKLVLEARFALNTVPDMMDVVAEELQKKGRAEKIQQIVCRRSYLTKQLHWSINPPIQYGGIKRLDKATHGVLLREQVKALKTLLNLDEPQKTCHVLLWGMGGVGKSISVRGLHDDPEIQSYFQGAVAFEELGEAPHLAAPQFQSDILKLTTGVHGQHFGDDVAGADVLRQQLRNRRVLLIVDNVWEGTSLETLEKLSFTLPAGSRVVVTSRSNLKFSRNTRWGEHVVYTEQRMDVLPIGEAQELLRWRVENLWPDAGPPADFEELVGPIAKECAGLPLAVDIVGAWLAEPRQPESSLTTLEHWKDTLRTIQQSSLDLDGSREPEIFRILRPSYESLGPKEKEMFLITAAFVPGPPLWEESLCHLFLAGADGRTPPDAKKVLQNLERRSLVNSGGHPNLAPIVVVHDLLRELANREVDTGPYRERKRVFSVGKAVEPELTSTRLEAAVCLSLSGSEILTLENSDGKPWHMLQSGCAPRLLAARLDQLALCRVPSEIRNWRMTLRLLDLSNCDRLVDLPDEIGELSELRVLSVANCVRLRSLPSSISRLTKLYRFDAHGCCSLASLPQSFFELSNFKNLWLWRATAIEVEHRGSALISLPVVDGTIVPLQEQLVGVKPLVQYASILDRNEGYLDGRASVLSKICSALEKLYNVKQHYNELLDAGIIHVLVTIGGRKREEHAAQQLAQYDTRWQALHALWSFALADRDSRFCEALLEPNVVDILLKIVKDGSESPDYQTQVAGIWRTLAQIRPEGAVMLRRLGAVHALVELVKGSSNHADLYQYGLSALGSFAGSDPGSLTLIINRGGVQAALRLIMRGISGGCTADAIRLLTFVVQEPRGRRALASAGCFAAAVCGCLSINGPRETYGLLLEIVFILLSDRSLGLLEFLADAQVSQLVRALVDGTARGWSEQIVCTELAYCLLAILGPDRVTLLSDEAAEPTVCKNWSRETVAELLGRTTSPLRPRLEALFLIVGCHSEADTWLHDPASAALVQQFLSSCLQKDDLSQLAAAVLHKILALRNRIPGRGANFVSTLSAQLLSTLTAMLNADKPSDGDGSCEPQENVLLALHEIAVALRCSGEEERRRFHAVATEAGLLPALEEHNRRLRDKLSGAQAGRVLQQAESDNIERWEPSADRSDDAMWTLRGCFVPFESSSIVEAWDHDWETAMMVGITSSAGAQSERLSRNVVHEIEDVPEHAPASGDVSEFGEVTPDTSPVFPRWWSWMAIGAAVLAVWTALKWLAGLAARLFVTPGGLAAVLEEVVEEAAENPPALSASAAAVGAGAVAAATAAGVIHCVRDGGAEMVDQPDVTPAGLLQRLRTGPSPDHFRTLQQLSEVLQRQDPVPYASESATNAVAAALVEGAVHWGGDVRCLAFVPTLLRALAHRPNAPPLRTKRGGEPVARVTEDRVRVLLGFIKDGSAPEHILPRLEDLYILVGSGKPCAGHVVEAGGLEALMWVAEWYTDEAVRRLAAAIVGAILVHVTDGPRSARLFRALRNGPAILAEFLLDKILETNDAAWVFAIETLARTGGSGRGVWLAAFGQYKQHFKALVTRLERGAEQGGGDAGALEAAAKSAARAYSLLLEPDVVELPNSLTDPFEGRARAADNLLPPAAVVDTTPRLERDPPQAAILDATPRLERDPPQAAILDATPRLERDPRQAADVSDTTSRPEGDPPQAASLDATPRLEGDPPQAADVSDTTPRVKGDPSHAPVADDTPGQEVDSVLETETGRATAGASAGYEASGDEELERDTALAVARSLEEAKRAANRSGPSKREGGRRPKSGA